MPQPLQAVAAQVVVADVRRGRDYSFEEGLLADRSVELALPVGARSRRRLLAQADVVFVHIRPFTADDVSRLERCVGIVIYGVAFDAVDLAAAELAGIPVRNVPGYCTEEVSDHALALVLAAERGIVHFANATRRGSWRTGRRRSLRRLGGQVLGIVGAGRIGRRIAHKSQAFGFRTIAYDPYVSASTPDLPLVALDELLTAADVIVVAAATTNTSVNLFDWLAFARVKPGVVFVNVARGAIVDESALLAAIDDGRVSWACLDVRREEPPARGDALLRHPRVLTTPHVAANSIEAARDLNREVAETALELLEMAGRIAPTEKRSRDG